MRSSVPPEGWSAGEEKEIYTLDELIEKFHHADSLHQVNLTLTCKYLLKTVISILVIPNTR